MIKNKLCYVVYPKSGSTSARSFLKNMGFSKPLGRYQHYPVDKIIEKTGKDDFLFFSVYREPYEHCISAYKHIILKQTQHKCWKDLAKNNSISDFDTWLDYLEKYKYDWNDQSPHPFFYFSDYFDNRDVIMLSIEELKPFIEEQLGRKIKENIPHENKSGNKINVKLTDEQNKRIDKIYEQNIEYIKKNKWKPQ
jgi:hypothetical protein